MTQVSINNEQINKTWFICTVEYYLAVKNDVLTQAMVWLNLKQILLSERSQT